MEDSGEEPAAVAVVEEEAEAGVVGGAEQHLRAETDGEGEGGAGEAAEAAEIGEYEPACVAAPEAGDQAEPEQVRGGVTNGRLILEQQSILKRGCWTGRKQEEEEKGKKGAKKQRKSVRM